VSDERDIADRGRVEDLHRRCPPKIESYTSEGWPGASV
jgi:hypothetical protein